MYSNDSGFTPPQKLGRGQWMTGWALATILLTSLLSGAKASDHFHGLCDAASTTPIPLMPLSANTFQGWLDMQTPLTQKRVEDAHFTATENSSFLVYDTDGTLNHVVFGVKDKDNFWTFAHMASQLPAYTYVLEEDQFSAEQLTRACLGWSLEHYRFNTYKTTTAKSENGTQLLWPRTADKDWVKNHYQATALIRDLVNTPASDLGPRELAQAATKVAKAYGATYTVTKGKDLLTLNYPMIHAVGRAAKQDPRLFELNWQGPNAQKSLVLVGKGVTYDTGGLTLKPLDSMRDMKRDMGGAAHALALAQMVMEAKLPINLRLLIPAVENSVSKDSYRPGDILKSRKGLTVEIGNTDAEGRLILADALTEGSSKKPDLIMDFATLTGAARIAVGPLVQPFFTNQDAVAQHLMASSKKAKDPLWQLPLFESYISELKSSVADLNNVGSSSHNGSITAALFLQHFVDADTPWVHFDICAWNKTSTPGKPDGGEATGLRAAFDYVSGAFLA